MKNKIVEYGNKAYIVEDVKEGKLKAKEYVYDTKTNKYKKLKGISIESDYQEIPLELVKIRYSKEVKETTKKDKK